MRRSQQVDEYGAGIEVAQASGLDETAEDLLRRGSALGSIPTGDLAIDDDAHFILPGSVTRATFTTRGTRWRASACS